MLPTVAQVPRRRREAHTGAVADRHQGLTRGVDRDVFQSASIVAEPIGACPHKHGYDADEHAEGLRLYRTAMGDGLPLPVVFGLAAPAAPTSAPTITPELRRIDAFENVWFPRTRAIIQRVVPKAGRERFEAAFFHELSQQPLGPGVVGSVRTWITRVEALATSDELGAREVFQTLRKRGLTPESLAEMKALVEGATAFGAPAAPAASGTTKVVEARADRQQALESLRAWYNDWSTTLRSVFDRRQLLQLGLIARRVRAKEKDEGEDGEASDPAADA
jgi:hypothetical protein